ISSSYQIVLKGQRPRVSQRILLFRPVVGLAIQSSTNILQVINWSGQVVVSTLRQRQSNNNLPLFYNT
ncbi:hypothetical protein PO909_000264, partial [Leuciscus waleckii]